MSTIKVLGIDLGKSSFHVIGRDYSDNQIIRKKFSRTALIQFSSPSTAMHNRVRGLWRCTLARQAM